jgi:hypothetical protein
MRNAGIIDEGCCAAVALRFSFFSIGSKPAYKV